MNFQMQGNMMITKNYTPVKKSEPQSGGMLVVKYRQRGF